MPVMLVTGDENANKQFRVPAPNQPEGIQVTTQAIPAGSSQASASAGATTATNTTATGGANAGLFTPITGNNFVQHLGSAIWTFSTNTCIWTYTGPAGRRFKLSLFASLVQLNNLVQAAAFVGIDFDDTLLGVAAAGNFTQGVNTWMFTSSHIAEAAAIEVATERIHSPTNGSTFRPMFAYDDNSNMSISRLAFNVAEVGAA